MKAFCGALLSFVGLFSCNLFGQQSVYIESHEMGRGILKGRSNECFMITPAHVVKDENRPFPIWGPQSSLLKGDLLDTYQPDLAIVRIIEGGNQNCEEWNLDPNYQKILAGSIDGFLEIAQKNGSIKSMKVFLSEKDNTIITIRPYFQGEEIVKGMSGSSLFTKVNEKKTYLGMLVSIIDPTTGVVLLATVINNVLGDFFNTPNHGSKAKLTTVGVVVLKGDTMDGFELAQKASDILAKQYPNYLFVPYEKGKSPDNVAVCEISELTEVDLKDKIDEQIYKFKSRIVLTVRNNSQLISRETLDGGGTDYSGEAAKSLSVMRTLELTEKLKFDKR